MIKIYNLLFLSILFISISPKFLSFGAVDNFNYKAYIESLGFKLEEHTTTTTDGYILSLWHLVDKSSTEKKTRAVMLQHGLIDSSWCFFQLKRMSLPIILMKHKYDVWLTNIRGNYFSLGHKTKNSADSSSSYWDFSLDDHVQYDLPAFVSYIKSKTGLSKIDYIGHSQGTTMFFMKYMSAPSFVENNFEHFIALSPVPNIKYSFFGPHKYIDILAEGLKEKYKFGDILNIPPVARNALAKFYKTSPGSLKWLIEKVAGTKPTGRTDYTEKYNLFYFFPSSSSKKNIMQWSQISKNGKLVYYSDGKTVKEYNVGNAKNWKVKSLLFKSNADSLSSRTDINAFYNSLTNKNYVELVKIDNFNHLDVLTATSAISEIYVKIINFLKN